MGSTPADAGPVDAAEATEAERQMPKKLEQRRLVNAVVRPAAFGGLFPALLDSPETVDISEQVFYLAGTCYQVRSDDWESVNPHDGEARIDRSERTEARGRARMIELESDWLDPIIRLELLETARCNWQPGDRGLPSVVMGDLLRLIGWQISPTMRGAACAALVREGRLIEPHPRWFAFNPDGPAGLEPGEPLLHLSRYIGSVTRVITQRQTDIVGSLFWNLRVVQTPARFKELMRLFAARLTEWLDVYGVTWREVPRGHEHEFALVCPSLISGLEVQEEGWAGPSGLVRRMVSCILGADICRRMGSVDDATSGLKRMIAEELLERAGGQEADDAEIDAWLRRRFAITLPTIEAWSRKQGPDDERSRINGGLPGLAAIELLDMLALVFPAALAEDEVQRRMRRRCSARVAHPAVVAVALRQLEADDRIYRVRKGNLYHYAARQGRIQHRLADRKQLMGSHEQNLRRLAWLAEQVLADSVAAFVMSRQRIVPRALLQGFVKDQEQEWEAIRLDANSSELVKSEEADLSPVYRPCVALFQCCITPVQPKRPDNRYQ